ncbi:MAG: hypothetical protein R3240_14365, partial [Gammaproteobacteria bacterium]|nr:hypothetical protein [Gammaproteobacteria bacterium]
MRLLFLFLILFSSSCIAETVLLKDGESWPPTLAQLPDSGSSTMNILFLPDKNRIEQRINSQPTIRINSNTHVYVPRGASIQAMPMTYTAPELASEVKEYYMQGLGVYTFWAFMVVFATV